MNTLQVAKPVEEVTFQRVTNRNRSQLRKNGRCSAHESAGKKAYISVHRCIYSKHARPFIQFSKLASV